MKEPPSEVLAKHTGLELYAGAGNGTGVATTAVSAGEPLSSEITFSVRRHSLCNGKTTQGARFAKPPNGTAESQNLSFYRNSKRAVER